MIHHRTTSARLHLNAMFDMSWQNNDLEAKFCFQHNPLSVRESVSSVTRHTQLTIIKASRHGQYTKIHPTTALLT